MLGGRRASEITPREVSHTDIKLSDFGLAKISRDYPRRLPRSTSICGSDFYLAPEVIKQEDATVCANKIASGLFLFLGDCLVRVARLNKVGMKEFFEVRIFSGKIFRNFPEYVEPLFCGSEEIPQNSRRISHKISLSK